MTDGVHFRDLPVADTAEFTDRVLARRPSEVPSAQDLQVPLDAVAAALGITPWRPGLVARAGRIVIYARGLYIALGDDTGQQAPSTNPRYAGIGGTLSTEVIRIAEFKAAAQTTLTGYSLVSGVSGTGGEAFVTESTGNNPVLYFLLDVVDADGTDNRAFMASVAVGDEFLIHQVAEVAYVLGKVDAVAMLDSDGALTTDPADAVNFRWTYTLDAERGLDDWNNLPQSGAVRIHFHQQPMRRDLSNAAASGIAAFLGSPDDLLALKSGAIRKYDFADARRHLLGPKNHVVLGTFAFESILPNTAGKIYIYDSAGGNDTVNITWASDDEENDLAEYLIAGQRLDFGNGYSGEITGDVNKNSVANGGFGFDIAEVKGAKPTGGNITVTAEGQEKVTRIAYIETTQNTGNAYRGSAEPDLLALDGGAAIAWQANATNTGASTLNVNGTGAKSIVRPDGAAVAAGEIVQDSYYLSIYWSDSWVTFGAAQSLLEALKADAGTAAKRAHYKAALATGRLQKDIAGAGAFALTAAEAAYDSIETTGAMTADRIGTLPASPTGPLLVRHQATGAYTLQLKASGQADAAAVALGAGDNVILRHGGSLALLGQVRQWKNTDIGTDYEAIAQGLDDDDLIIVTAEGVEDNNKFTRQFIERWGNVDAEERILFGAQSYNEVLIMQKSGSTLNAKRGGGLSATTKTTVLAERRVFADIALT